MGWLWLDGRLGGLHRAVMSSVESNCMLLLKFRHDPPSAAMCRPLIAVAGHCWPMVADAVPMLAAGTCMHVHARA